MGLINVHSYLAGHWTAADDGARPIASAVTGEPLAIAGQARLDTQAMIDFAHTKGGPALRAMSVHDRARMLKALALELGKFKDELYALSCTTGATRADAMIDIDGGIGTMLVYASKGRREMPDGRSMHVHVEINGGAMMFNDPFPEHGVADAPPAHIVLHLIVDDADAWWKRATEAGAEIVHPIKVEIWGDKYGQLRDPFGVHWGVVGPA